MLQVHTVIPVGTAARSHPKCRICDFTRAGDATVLGWE